MLRRSTCLTLCLSYCEGRMKACICKCSLFEIDHNGWRSVATRVLVPKCVGGGGGVKMYMTQCGVRGATSPTATFSFCDSGRESYCVMACLAAVLTRLLARMFVWARNLWRVVLNPCRRLSSRRSGNFINNSMW